jgi:hypothetical protein
MSLPCAGGTAAGYFDFFHDLSEPAIEAHVAAHQAKHESNVEIRYRGGALGHALRHPGHRPPPDGREASPRTASAFTSVNFQRLRQAKAAYDPKNFFRINHNIAVAAQVAVPAGVSSRENVG